MNTGCTEYGVVIESPQIIVLIVVLIRKSSPESPWGSRRGGSSNTVPADDLTPPSASVSILAGSKPVHLLLGTVLFVEE